MDALNVSAIFKKILIIQKTALKFLIKHGLSDTTYNDGKEESPTIIKAK